MQDRFKYRIWCINKNAWEDDFCYLPPDGILMRKLQMADGFQEARTNHIIGFSTGLKDKNNKLIYEGDILFINRIRIAQVVFRTGAFFVQFSKDKYHAMGVGGYEANELEIIGNIYENPELLE